MIWVYIYMAAGHGLVLGNLLYYYVLDYYIWEAIFIVDGCGI